MPSIHRIRRSAGAPIGVLLTVTIILTGCTSSAGTEPVVTPSAPPATTLTSTVGTSTIMSTVTTTVQTLTVPGTITTVTASPSGADAAGPPPKTSEPSPVLGTCPYLSNAEVKDANGQGTGQTSIIKVKPYPVCLFTRSDGRYLAASRIVVAQSPEQATAAVNEHTPVAKSNPASYPKGWSGGAMATPKGIPGNDQVRSVYAVSKGKIAIIAYSNQAQSIKGRQMVEQIVRNLGL